MKYLLLLLLCITFVSQAIIIRHDTPPANYQVTNNQYPSVIDLTYLTGTLINEQWILTAAHGTPYLPAQQQIKIGDNQYRVEYIIVHPDYDTNNLSHDMALLKLDRKVTNVKSTGIYLAADEKSQHVWFVGKGDTGNGKLGVTGGSDVINHAENIIDEVKSLWIIFDFDSPKNKALTLEGISGPGDSGGPAFITTPSGLKVAGVSSHQRNNAQGEGFYGVEEYYTRTSAHQSWIDRTIKSSVDVLKKHALPRTNYIAIDATTDEVSALLGSYLLEDGSEFILEPCEHNVCYRWAGTSRQIQLLKASNGYWFSPQVNRAFTVTTNSDQQVTQLNMADFHGDRVLTKKVTTQVKALKAKINTRDRKLLHHAEPVWPEKALINKVHGSVTMSFSIKLDGSVHNILVTESSPKGVFEQTEKKALSQWRYASLDKPLNNILTRFDFDPTL
jgi:TonB family protein